MVMVQLKEEVVPSCASGAGEWSRLIVSEFEFSCPCLQEAFTDFLSLLLGPALVVLALHCGAESDTLNSKIVSVSGTSGLVEVWHVGKLRPREREWHT